MIPIARKILNELSIDGKTIDEVVEIIAHHHSLRKVNTINFRILYDADWLGNLPDEYDISDKEKTERVIEKLFLTETGKAIAREEFLG